MINRLRKKSKQHHPSQKPQMTKYHGITLTKELKDPYDKNSKSLKKEIEEDTGK